MKRNLFPSNKNKNYSQLLYWMKQKGFDSTFKKYIFKKVSIYKFIKYFNSYFRSIFVQWY